MNKPKYIVRRHFYYSCDSVQDENSYNKDIRVNFCTDIFNTAYDVFQDFIQTLRYEYEQYYDGRPEEVLRCSASLYENNNLIDKFGSKTNKKTGMIYLDKI